LADHVLNVLDCHLGKPPVAAAPEDEANAAAVAPSPVRQTTIFPADPNHDPRPERPDNVPLRVVLGACPDIADYARGEIRSYRDLLATAAMVRPMLGISPSAWDEAGHVMGEAHASAVVAAILQRGAAIKNPGGYLRNLTRRAAADQFSVWSMLMALAAARLKQAPARTGL
jgi:replication initiation protein RepC